MISLTILWTASIGARASAYGEYYYIQDLQVNQYSDNMYMSKRVTSADVGNYDLGVTLNKLLFSVPDTFMVAGRSYKIRFTYTFVGNLNGPAPIAGYLGFTPSNITGSVSVVNNGKACIDIPFTTNTNTAEFVFLAPENGNYSFSLAGKLLGSGYLYVASGYDYTVNMYGSYVFKFSTISVQDISSGGSSSTDNYLESMDESLKQQTEIMEEQKETTKNIFQLIGDFFKGFFDNLIGIFLPKPDYFVSYVERIRALFEQKMSLFYYPVESFIKIMAAISGADGGEAVLSMPDVKWQDTVIIPATEVRLSEYVDMFPGMQTALHLVTNVIFIGAFILYLQNKIKEWLQRC